VAPVRALRQGQIQEGVAAHTGHGSQKEATREENEILHKEPYVSTSPLNGGFTCDRARKGRTDMERSRSLSKKPICGGRA
jgi:hypothetical protein